MCVCNSAVCLSNIKSTRTAAAAALEETANHEEREKLFLNASLQTIAGMSKWVLHGNNKIQCNSFLFNMASVDAEVDERMGGGEGGGEQRK